MNYTPPGPFPPSAGSGQSGTKPGSQFSRWVPVAVLLLCLLPFINKPIHLDDVIYLRSAQQILEHGLDPFGFDYNWYGNPQPMHAHINHPPLHSYFLAFVLAVFGESELILHVLYLIPALALAFCCHRLAQRCCAHPALAAVAAILTPLVVVSATTLMSDLLMAAFWVWAVALWVDAEDSESRGHSWGAAICATACTMTSYYGFSVVLLMAALTLYRHRFVSPRLLYLLLPSAAFIGWQLYFFWLYGRLPLVTASGFAISESAPFSLPTRILTGLSFTGGCLLTVTIASPLLYNRRSWLIVAGILLGLTWVAADVRIISSPTVFTSKGTEWSALLHLWLFISGGVSLLYLAGEDFYRNRDDLSFLLLLWIVGCFVFATMVNWTVSARSILPIAPAAGILLVRRCQHYNRPPRRLLIPVLLSLTCSVLIAGADQRFAQNSRLAAKRFQDVKGTETMYFQGHWGFQYYMEAAGAVAFDRRAGRFAVGNLIAIADHNYNTYLLHPDQWQLMDKFELPPLAWGATMDAHLGAGFYSSIWGALPYAFGRPVPDRFTLWQIRHKVEFGTGSEPP